MKAKTILAALAFVATSSAFAGASKSVSFNTGVSRVSLDGAAYALVPTETMTRPIPGCVEGGEAGNVCEETVVVASKPVVNVFLSYSDSFRPANERGQATVTFDVSDFSAEEVELLKSVYPGWKFPFSNVSREFGKGKFSLDVQTVKKTIQIVDVANSKLCPIIGEAGLPDPNCTEELVYKESWTWAVVATVTKK